MMTRAAFLARYPEFGETDTGVVDAALAEAEVQIDPNVWGKFEDAGHGLLTAHMLADNPLGNAAKLVTSGGTDPSTVYERRFRRLQNVVAAGIRSI